MIIIYTNVSEEDSYPHHIYKGLLCARIFFDIVLFTDTTKLMNN